MKKRFLSLLLAAALTIPLAACGSTSSGSAEAPQETDSTSVSTIRFAVQKNTYLPWIADSLGYFEEEFADDGIQVELTQFSLGPEVIEAIGSEAVDFGVLGDLPCYAGLVNGGAYKIIGKYEKDFSRGLIARDDANISTFADLKGKKLAVPLGSNLQPLAEIFLQEGGLSDDDVEIVNLSLADITTSITNGDVDAAVTDEPYISQAIEGGGITQLSDSKGYKTYVSPIIALNAFSDANPELTSRVLKVLQRAAEWRDAHPDEAVQVASEATGVSPEDVEPKMAGSDYNVYLSDEDIEALKEGAEQSYEFGLIKEPLNVEDYIDTSFYENIQ